MTIIHLSQALHERIRSHLFSDDAEQVAFAFADWDEVPKTLRIRAVDLIPTAGFAFQSDYHIELEHDQHARIIKTAFDLQACLVEFHSHRSKHPARFSPTDLDGFQEFVPHVRWRLAGRPYAAIVWHETSFDGLLWIDRPPVQVEGIQVHPGPLLQASRLTLTRLRETHGTHSL